MNTFQVFYYFLMHSGKFMIDSHRSVFIGLFASFCIRTSGTVFTLVYFFLSSILIPFYMLAVLQMKSFPIRTTQDSIFSDGEVDCTKRIIMIRLIRCFLCAWRRTSLMGESRVFCKLLSACQ